MYPLRDLVENFLDCTKRTIGWSSGDGDAEEGNDPASKQCRYFISALPRLTLKIPSAKLNIAIPNRVSCCQVLPATVKGTAARMKGGKGLGKGVQAKVEA